MGTLPTSDTNAHSIQLISILSGFGHFVLVLFMVLWQSLDTPVMSCFYVSSWLRVCTSHVLSHLRALFCVGAWCLDPGTHVMSFGYVSRFGHSCYMSRCVSVQSRVRSATHSSVHVFYVACSSCFYQFISLCISLAACFHVAMSCVNMQLMSILTSCMFVSCLAHGCWFVLLAICLCFCFMWAHGFCLSFLCAMYFHVNFLDPTHLVTWLLVNLPHLCFPRHPPHLLPL